jgi:hypothetical protein
MPDVMGDGVTSWAGNSTEEALEATDEGACTPTAAVGSEPGVDDDGLMGSEVTNVRFVVPGDCNADSAVLPPLMLIPIVLLDAPPLGSELLLMWAVRRAAASALSDEDDVTPTASGSCTDATPKGCPLVERSGEDMSSASGGGRREPDMIGRVWGVLCRACECVEQNGMGFETATHAHMQTNRQQLSQSRR